MTGIKYNVQAREENVYLVSEGELNSLASVGFTASLVVSLGAVLLGIAIPDALDVNAPWTLAKYVKVIGCIAVAIVLFIWCYRDVMQGKNLLKRIKRKPKPESKGNN